MKRGWEMRQMFFSTRNVCSTSEVWIGMLSLCRLNCPCCLSLWFFWTKFAVFVKLVQVSGVLLKMSGNSLSRQCTKSSVWKNGTLRVKLWVHLSHFAKRVLKVWQHMNTILYKFKFTLKAPCFSPPLPFCLICQAIQVSDYPGDVIGFLFVTLFSWWRPEAYVPARPYSCTKGNDNLPLVY